MKRPEPTAIETGRRRCGRGEMNVFERLAQALISPLQSTQKEKSCSCKSVLSTGGWTQRMDGDWGPPGNNGATG